MSTRARPPGRPREARYDAIILREVVRELSERGFRSFSVQRVANRAGVARATVRLRWPDRDQLMFDGVATTSHAVTRPSSGTLREDLHHIAHEWAELFRSETLMRLFGHLQGYADDDAAFFARYQSELVGPANQIVIDTIERGATRGEVRPGVNPRAAARCLVGALYLQSTMTRGAISPRFESDVAELVAAAVQKLPEAREESSS
jgi:AcrR family transcriptional regulator